MIHSYNKVLLRNKKGQISNVQTWMNFKTIMLNKGI